MADLVDVMALADLLPGTCREARVGDKTLALYNVAGTVYATTNTCLHRGGPLGQGMMEGPVIVCPWHAWTFDVTTGCHSVNPSLKLQTYPVTVEDGRIKVEL